MPLIDGHSAPLFELGKIRFKGLASPTRGATENSVWHLTIGTGVPHRESHQVTREEVFVAIAGEAHVRLGGDELTLREGSALIVPAHTDFSISNVSNAPFEAVVVLPAGAHAVTQAQGSFVPPWAA